MIIDDVKLFALHQEIAMPGDEMVCINIQSLRFEII